MATITIKYSQPTSSIIGDPPSVAINLSRFKISESLLEQIIDGYTTKYSSKPSTTPGMAIDWFLEKNLPDPTSNQIENFQQSITISKIVSGVSCASSISGSGDPSDMLKSSLPKATQKLLKHIIKSWLSGYDMNAHQSAEEQYSIIMTMISQLSSLIPTAIPDGIPACTAGMNIYTQLMTILKTTFLKMPNTITTSDIQAAKEQMSSIKTQNESFNSSISAIVFCAWMKIPPQLKLPIAYTNLTILIQALQQLLSNWLSGMTQSNLKAVDTLLDTIQ